MKNNIIGIIGGMGPQASAEFYRMLIDRAKQCYGAHDNNDYPEILIDSVPVPDFLSDTENMEEAAIMLEDRVKRLTVFGATTLTVACNTACILIERLQKQTNIPVISVVDEVVRVILTDKKKVLLLASPTSLRLGLYQSALSRHHISYVIPMEKEYKELELIIRGVIDNEDRRFLMRRLIKVAERYIEKADIEGIVLGCTELPLVFPTDFYLPVYSSLSVLAECLLKQYYKERRII